MTTLATPVNVAQSTIATGESYTRGTSTTIVLTDASVFPNSAQVIQISYGDHWCLVVYTSKATNTLTMGGGAADYALAKNVSVGDEAYEFPAGSYVEIVCAADHWAQTVRADGSVPLTSGWDVGAHGIRALNFTADGLTSGRVIFAGANGLLSDDAGLLWDTTNKQLTIQTTDTKDPTLIFKTTNTANQVNLYLDESAPDDTFRIVGQTAGVATYLQIYSKAGYNAGFYLFDTWTNRFQFYLSGFTNNVVLTHSAQDKDIAIEINDGGVTTEVARFDGSVSSLLLFGNTAPGTNGVKVAVWGAGTAPTTSPANVSQLWSADVNAAAGYAWLHGRDEKGHTMIVAGVVLKTDTGHPADPHESLIEINTFDNKVNIYGDAGWREMATW